MQWIPGAKSIKWLYVAGASTLAVSILLWLVRFGILNQTLTATHMLRFMLLALLLSAVFSFAGWLGARLLWLFSNAGLLIGIISMALTAGERNGWEDLIGLLNFMLLTVAGFAAGLVAELIMLLVKRSRRS